MDEPPVTVKCRECGQTCGAEAKVTSRAFGKERWKWLFKCMNWKCSLAFGDVQHREPFVKR